MLQRLIAKSIASAHSSSPSPMATLMRIICNHTTTLSDARLYSLSRRGSHTRRFFAMIWEIRVMKIDSTSKSIPRATAGARAATPKICPFCLEFNMICVGWGSGFHRQSYLLSKKGQFSLLLTSKYSILPITAKMPAFVLKNKYAKYVKIKKSKK